MVFLAAVVAIALALALYVGVSIIGAVVTAPIVWLAWNVFDLHDLLGLGSASFWQILGLALLISLFRSGETKVNG